MLLLGSSCFWVLAADSVGKNMFIYRCICIHVLHKHTCTDVLICLHSWAHQHAHTYTRTYFRNHHFICSFFSVKILAPNMTNTFMHLLKPIIHLKYFHNFLTHTIIINNSTKKSLGLVWASAIKSHTSLCPRPRVQSETFRPSAFRLDLSFIPLPCDYGVHLKYD